MKLQCMHASSSEVGGRGGGIPGHTLNHTHTHTHDLLLFIGQELKVIQYEPPKPRPMVRPAYLSLVSSPAGIAIGLCNNIHWNISLCFFPSSSFQLYLSILLLTSINYRLNPESLPHRLIHVHTCYTKQTLFLVISTLIIYFLKYSKNLYYYIIYTWSRNYLFIIIIKFSLLINN